MGISFKKARLAIAGVAGAIVLNGCMSTSEYPVTRLWMDEPLISSNECNSFSWENVSSFAVKYYVVSETAEAATSGSGANALENYLLSAALINRANLCMAEALEMSDVIAQLNEERNILIGGTSISETELAKHRTLSKGVTLAINDKVAEVEKLSPDQSVAMTIGIGSFALGSFTSTKTLEYAKDMVAESSSMASGGMTSIIANAGTAVNAVGQAAIFAVVVNGLTDLGPTWWDTSKTLYAFAENTDGVSVPVDPTSLFLGEG